MDKEGQRLNIYAFFDFTSIVQGRQDLWERIKVFVLFDREGDPSTTFVSDKGLYPNFPGGSEVKASACNAGDLGSIPGSGRSPGEGNGNPLLYSCLENPMDGGAWWATVHGVTKSQT